MAGNGALELSIKIAGRVDASLTGAIKQTQSLIGSMNTSLAKSTANTIGTIGKAGLAIMAGLTTATTAMIAKTTNMAKEYEAQTADVVKYVSGIMDSSTGEINRTMQSKMQDQILKLTTQLPMGREEMAQIAAALGQSGKSYKEIFEGSSGDGSDSYLYDAAKMAAAWDIEAKQAADYMAKWETAFNKTHDEVIDVADSINYLGANMATTAAEIAAVVNTSGGVGQTAGADLGTTSALAATMLAMGVEEGKAGTSLNRIYTNASLGSSATSAQKSAWQSLGFTAEGIAKAMQSTGANGEDGAASTLYSVFKAISEQDADKQTATIKTLFGQWAIEGVSKIVGNLPAFQNALLMSGDTSAYSGSMEKELLVKMDTAEAVSQMAGNATDRLLINIGEQFLPVEKQLAGMWIDIANGLTESLPDLSNLVSGILPMFETALQGIGNAAQAALPWIQKGVNYIAENGADAAGAIAALVATFASMTAAPALYSAGSSIVGMIGNTVVGGKRNAAGGYYGGTTIANLLKPKNLISGAGKLAGSAKQFVGGTALPAVTGYIANAKNIPGNVISAMTAAANPAGAATATIGGVLAAGAGAAFGKGGLNLTGGAAAIAGKLGSGFLSLLGTFGPIITGIGGIIALVSILSDHFEDIRNVVGSVFGASGLTMFDGFAAKLSNIGTTVQDAFASFTTQEGLQGIQETLSGFSVGGLNLGDVFGAMMPALQTVMPLIQSFAGVFNQIVDLGVNYIKPVILEIFDFLINEGIPAVVPMLSTIVSLIGTVLVNAIKVIFAALQSAMPVIEAGILGFIGMVKSIATIGVQVVNFIIRALNMISFDVPDWVPIIGGGKFGFNLKEVALPRFANGGFTEGPSIAGEAGTEAIISFRQSQREKNVGTWLQAGRMLGLLRDYQQERRVMIPGQNLQGSSSARRYTGSDGATYNYAPSFTVYGNANEADLRGVLEESYERFCEYIEKYINEKRRVSYG